MNRRLFALLLAVMMLTLCACGSKPTPSGIVKGEDDGDLDDVVVEIDAPSAGNQPAVQEKELTDDEDVASDEATSPEDASESKEEESKATEVPTDAPEETTVPTPPASGTTEFEWYNALSGDEQMAFMESFESVPAFFDWYNAAKAEYDALHPEIEVGDDVIDLGDQVDGNG